MTAFTVIIAEEMDADWPGCTDQFFPIEPFHPSRAAMGGLSAIPMITGSSQDSELLPRPAGMPARRRATCSCTTPLKSGRACTERSTRGRGSYYKAGEAENELMEIETLKLRHNSRNTGSGMEKTGRFSRLIERKDPRFDIPGKVDGGALCSASMLQVPGMVRRDLAITGKWLETRICST